MPETSLNTLQWNGNDLYAQFKWCLSHQRMVLPLYARWYQGDLHYHNRNFTNLLHSDQHSTFGVYSCESTTPLGTSRTQRLGPFVSTGGYDWWQLALKNALGLEELKYPVGILAHWTGPVDTLLSPIPLPPIHQHHVHVMPCTRGDFCSGFHGLRVIEHHGDWQFDSAGGGINSFGQYYAGLAKFVPGSVSADLELNDVRPRRSGEMCWWYQISIILNSMASTNGQSHVFLSLHRIHGPGQSCESQFCDVFPFNVPSHQDSFTVYAGLLPVSGSLHDVVFHAHQVAFQHALLFSGTPETFSWGRALSPPRTFETVKTSEAGFDSNYALRAFVLKSPADRPVCMSKWNGEMVNNSWYDRASVPSCVDWTFKARSSFTAIAFNGPTKFSSIPGITRQHAIWFLTYQAADGASHYTQSLCVTRRGSLLISSSCIPERQLSPPVPFPVSFLQSVGTFPVAIFCCICLFFQHACSSERLSCM